MKMWCGVPCCGVWLGCIGLLMLAGCDADVGEECGELAGVAHGDVKCEEDAVCVDALYNNGRTECKAKRKLGESCEIYMQCPDNTQCFMANPSDKYGVCRELQKEGEFCDGDHASNSLVCDYRLGIFCLDNKCVKGNRAEGERCYVGIDTSCAAQFYCFPSDRDDPVVSYEDLPNFDRNNGICKPGEGEGGRCNGQWDIGCAPGLECFGNDCIKKDE